MNSISGRRIEDEPEMCVEGFLHCCICSYKWKPKKDAPPKKCPNCRSIKWNHQHASALRVCRRCGHTWRSSFPDPRKCPSCQSVRWNDDPLDFECRRCGHMWQTRSYNSPRRCPKCRSQKWDLPAEIFECGKCGHTMAIKSNTRRGMCPICEGNIQRRECGKCGNVWDSSRGRSPKKCPSCGSKKWASPNSRN